MKFHPTPAYLQLLCFIFFAFVIIISCSKDDDTFARKVLNDASTSVEQTTEVETGDEETEAVQDETAEEDAIETTIQLIYETRTTTFLAINDAHLQDEIGFNQDIVRMEEGRRTSYLMFDLSQIDSIGGTINSTNLEFTVDSDGGNGSVSVFKATSNDWSEKKLSAKTAPQTEVLIGELSAKYEVGQTQEIALDTAFIDNEVLTLVMLQKGGNDIAFASKENPNGKGPALLVTYIAPQDAEAIVLADEQELELQAEVATAIDATKENAEENTANQESNITEEDAIAEEPMDEESNITEETIEDDTAGEEATAEEVVEEETKTKETTEEEVTDVKPEGETLTTQETTDEATKEQTNSEADAPQNKAPIAEAQASPSSGTLPLKVTFDGSSSNDDNGIEKYVWDFRDGSTSSQPNPVHTFEKTGTLEVRLTVTDAQGETNTDTVTIVIKEEEEENKAPAAVAEASTLSGEAPLEIQFTANGSTDDGEVENYRWNFKDGNTTGTKNPSHTFDKVGTYKVELTVTDDKGLTDSNTLTITVEEKENEAPVAAASPSPQSGYAPLEVTFNANKSKDDKGIEGYFWDFKDGSTTTTKNPTHTFSNPGNYEVELSVKDEEGKTHATTITIKVDQRPVDNGGDNGDNGSGGDTANGNDDSGNSGSGTNNGNGGTTNSNSGNYPSNAVFASSFGFKSGDATDAFQSALKSGSSYIVVDKQSSDWVIRPTSIFDLKNTTIVFERGVTLRAKSGAFGQTNDQLFQLLRANNVTIEGYGATFKMNKKEYSNGEHRHALAINKCKNVTVRGLTLQDSGGDGILIAGMEAGSYSEDITIEDVIARNNKRLGMGIISAQDVWVRNSEFSNTKGTLPEAGVDLEPNNASERLVNINFINCKFSNNASRGFFLSTGKLNSSSRPVSIKVTNSDFSNNASGGKKSVAEIELSPGITTNPVRGEIVFEGARFNGSNNNILFSKKSAESYSAVFRNCIAKDVAKNSNAAISLEALSTVNTLGGFVFDNFDIQLNSNATFMQISAPSSGLTVKDIKGDFTVRDPNDSPLEYRNGYNTSKNVNVSIDYRHY